MLRKLFFRKPPDGLLEICDRVYVFNCCFTNDDAKREQNYKLYMDRILGQFREKVPEASILVFNFREEHPKTKIRNNIFSEYEITLMDYPCHYLGCPVLQMDLVHHFLRSGERWLTRGNHNVLLMHCDRGGWPILAFMLAALLIFRKQYSGEQRTLDMVYKQAPKELLRSLTAVNPIPSQLRYLQYVSRRNVVLDWPQLERALRLDSIILSFIPKFDGESGCRPILRVYGQDPFLADKSPKILYSTLKRNRNVWAYKQGEQELIKVDISCHIQGDVLIECNNLNGDMESEKLMFRAMFNTAFIRSNILMLNRDKLDVLWDAKGHFPKDFRVEILFSEMDTAAAVLVNSTSCFEEKKGLPFEAFAQVQEIFKHVDCKKPRENAELNVPQQISASAAIQDKLNTRCDLYVKTGTFLQETDPKMPLEKRNEANSVSISPRTPPPKPNAKEVHDSSPSSVDTSSSVSISPQTPPLELPLTSSAKEFYDSSPSSVDTSSSNSSSPRTPPLEPPLIIHNAKEVHGSPLCKESCPHYLLPLQSRKPITEETEVQSRDRSQSFMFSSKPETPFACTSHNKSPALSSTKRFSDNFLSRKEDKTINVDASKCVTDSTNLDKKLLASDLTLSGLLDPSDVSISPGTPSSRPSLNCRAKEVNDSPPHMESNPRHLFPLQSRHPVTKETETHSQDRSQSFMFSSTPGTPSSCSFHNKSPADAASHPSVSAITSTRPPPPFPSLSYPARPVKKILRARTRLASSPSQTPTPRPPSCTPLLKDHKPIIAELPPPKEEPHVRDGPPPPPPSPLKEKPHVTVEPTTAPPPPPPPPPPCLSEKTRSPPVPAVPAAPPPPTPFDKGGLQPDNDFPSSFSVGCDGNNASGTTGPRSSSLTGSKGQIPSHTMSSKNQTKKLKPLHWLKLSRAVQGSLWAEAQKSGDASKAPKIDMLELESLFSASVPSSGPAKKSKVHNSVAPKSDKVQLIEHTRAYNCEILLSKVKVPLHDLMSSVLALEESALDIDQVENLIKICPTKEEMEVLKGYTGEKEKLERCEQFFLELMKVPRVESKLRVFSFKIQFQSQVSDVGNSLHVVNAATEEIRNSAKLKKIMQTILSLGNALNQGTARGSAIGFRLDSLLKLTETRSQNKKMTLMNYLCKVLADQLPEVLDFSKDLANLEPAAKIQMKFLAEEMQAISKGLEKVEHELSAAQNDGPMSETFHKSLKKFFCSAEAEVRSLASLYSIMGANADALILYFGEDPSRCPFEQVVTTLLNFTGMFKKAHEENCKQL